MDTAVMLIDMQTDMLAKLPPGEKERIIAHQLTVLEYCRDNNVHVIVVTYAGDHHKGITSRLTAILDTMEVHRIEKKYDNAFPGTGLQRHLIQSRISKIFFMGITGNMCVRGTAGDARFKGWDIMISPDVIADYAHHDDPLPWYRENCSEFFETAQDFLDWLEARKALA